MSESRPLGTADGGRIEQKHVGYLDAAEPLHRTIIEITTSCNFLQLSAIFIKNLYQFVLFKIGQIISVSNLISPFSYKVIYLANRQGKI